MNIDKLKENIILDKKIFSAIENVYVNGRSQYSNCDIEWIRLYLSDQVKTKLKDEYKEVIALHIMPYRININDVRCAINKDDLKTKQEKYGYTKFNEIIKENPNYVDYDFSTGNIHKKVNYDYQIVCVINDSQYGPKWKEKPNNKLELKNIKTSWYYPKIDEREENLCKNFNEEDTINYINKLIKNMLKEIL